MRAALVCLTLALGTGCRMIITPPAEVAEPASVFLLDHGRHSSLLLPRRGDDRFVEYNYGDWGWFALDRSAFFDVFPTLFWPTQGTLGRAEWPAVDDRAAVMRRRPCEDVLPIVAEAARVHALVDELDRRYAVHAETARYQPLYDLSFAHDDEPYCVFHNCNDVMAEWLRALGCEVRGTTTWAEFEIAGAAPP